MGGTGRGPPGASPGRSTKGRSRRREVPADRRRHRLDRLEISGTATGKQIHPVAFMDESQNLEQTYGIDPARGDQGLVGVDAAHGFFQDDLVRYALLQIALDAHPVSLRSSSARSADRSALPVEVRGIAERTSIRS